MAHADELIGFAFPAIRLPKSSTLRGDRPPSARSKRHRYPGNWDFLSVTGLLRSGGVFAAELEFVAIVVDGPGSLDCM